MKLSRLAFFDGTSPVADTNLRTLPESMLLIRYGKTAFTKGGIRGEFDFREEDADGVIRMSAVEYETDYLDVIAAETEKLLRKIERQNP